MRRFGLGALLAVLTGMFAPVASTHDVIRFGFRQHAKRTTTVAQAKREGRKRRNVRARTAK